MQWANMWRRWFPEPPEELVRVRSKARTLAGENKRLGVERDRARSDLARQVAQNEDAERRLGRLRHEIAEQESAIGLLEKERETMAMVVKRFQAIMEHDAAMKVIDIEEAKGRLKRNGESGR